MGAQSLLLLLVGQTADVLEEKETRKVWSACCSLRLVVGRRPRGARSCCCWAGTSGLLGVLLMLVLLIVLLILPVTIERLCFSSSRP